MSGIEYVKLERDSVERCVRELRAAIFDVADALTAVDGEGQVALELARAISNIQKAHSWLETETGMWKRESEAAE